jgi:hypothetical protein
MSEKTESALDKLVYGSMGNYEANIELTQLKEYAAAKEHGYELQVAKSDRDEETIRQLQAELDKCIAWHEGDCSPHAQLEQTIAELRTALKEAGDRFPTYCQWLAWCNRHAHLLEEPK